MKKKLFFLLMVLLFASLFMGCLASTETTVTRIEDKPADDTPPADNTSPVDSLPLTETQPPMEDWVIIDHKTRDFGGNIPDWVTSTAMELESQPAFEGLYVFVIDQVGKDLQGLQLWARGFIAPSEVARMVSTRVEDKFVGAAAGDMDMLETYMEEVVKSVSEAEFPGLRTADSFWVKKQNRNNTSMIEYRYLFLVTVPVEAVNLSIQRTFDQTINNNPPKTEDEQTAINRVQDSFDSDL